jgi:hypothetical protein
MRNSTLDEENGWAVAIALVVGVAVALALLVGIQGAAAAQPGGIAAASSAQSCGDVVVKFKPEGSGGAHAIRATKVTCTQARNVARSCIEGNVAGGWTATLWDGRMLLVDGAKKIRYLPVGGGGCGYMQQSCKDFGYRGVGFFNLEAVGISCGGAKAKAKAWYDQGGSCSFGHTCSVAGYRCEADAKTGTVNCRRQNGFRFRWQMGE